MKISNVLLAESDLPPIAPGIYYEYIVAGNGLFIRTEDSRLMALVQIAPAQLRGCVDLIPFVELKIDRVPGVWLRSVLASARQHLPDEALYQFHFGGQTHKAVTHTWRCSMPEQTTTPTGIKFADDGLAVIDLHSHNSMPAFFSSTDDDDEQGLRFYAVIGRVDTNTPEIRCRVGVYGHHMDVPADLLFDDLGPFIDAIDSNSPPAHVASRGELEGGRCEGERTCRVCGCTDQHGCPNGCFWVADDLCSNCGDVPPARQDDPGEMALAPYRAAWRKMTENINR